MQTIALKKTIALKETTRGWEGRYKQGRHIVAAQTFDAPDQDNFETAANFALRQAGLDYKVVPLGVPEAEDEPVAVNMVTGRES